MQPVTRGMQLWAPTKHKDLHQVSLLRALMAVSRTSPPIQDLPRCKPSLSPPGHSGRINRLMFGQAPCPLSLPAPGHRPLSKQLQTLGVSCKTAVSHAWLILPTSPAGCGHMSSPAGTFCPAPPRISSLRARGFSGRPSQFGSREKMRSGAAGFWSQPSVVAAVVTGGWSAASAISDMLSRLRAGKFGALVTMLHRVVSRQSVLL